MIKNISKIEENYRNNLLFTIKEIFNEGSQKLEKRFKLDNNGEQCVKGYSSLIDKILKLILSKSLKNINLKKNKSICLIAVGGYGREELAPKSDIDILFLTPKIKSKSIKDLIQYILYLLWDVGFSLGHSTRSVNEVLYDSKTDITIRTSLLDRRYI